MALVSDELWALVAPLLPPPRPRPKGGRPPVDDRKALAGILFVLKSGIPWAMLPKEMGCGSGMTCWRRLRDWQAAGVFERLHRALLDRFRRLTVRYERRLDILLGFHRLAAALICLRFVERWFVPTDHRPTEPLTSPGR